MPTRGRKPKPTALKVLEGNPGKRRLNDNEPRPEKKAPSCPKWLEPEAKKEWRRLAKKMEMMGVLTEVDMAAFAGYCQAYARWKEAEEFITQHGTIVRTPSGYWQTVPQVSIAQTYLKVMNRFAEQFGLTPASRSRIIADTGNHGGSDEIASLAASAASVVAVAGDLVQMSPTAILMVHDPMTFAIGNAKDMERAIKTLNEVKESIINAYMAKTGLRHNKIAELMSNETWMNAKKAVEYGFADVVLYEDAKKTDAKPENDPNEGDEDISTQKGEDSDAEEEKISPQLMQAGHLYSTRLMGQAILNRIMDSLPKDAIPAAEADGSKASEKPPEDGVIIDDQTDTTTVVIGMDGKTADGSMPFAILEKQLEFLR